MALFVDTGALVRFYYPEPYSDKVEQAILAADQVFLSVISIVELSSALMKKVRLKQLENRDRMLIWQTFVNDLQTDSMQVLSLSEDDYFRAAKLIQTHGNDLNLRSLDSLQLASAREVDEVVFLTFDTDLQKIAQSVGLQLMELG